MFGSYRPIAYTTPDGDVYCTDHGEARGLHYDDDAGRVPPWEAESIEGLACPDCTDLEHQAQELHPVPPDTNPPLSELLEHRVKYSGSRN